MDNWRCVTILEDATKYSNHLCSPRNFLDQIGFCLFFLMEFPYYYFFVASPYSLLGVASDFLYQADFTVFQKPCLSRECTRRIPIRNFFGKEFSMT